MKYAFVIDENSFMSAHTLEDDRGVPDQSSSLLFQAAVGNCHSISISNPMLSRYSRKYDALKQRFLAGTPILPILMSADFGSKVIHIPFPPEIQGEAGLPNDDIPVVRLAAATQAILVTMDGPLMNRLERTGIAAGNNIRVLRPQDALAIAQTPAL